MNRILITLILAALTAGQALAESQLTEEKKNLIDTLLEQTGQSAIDMGTQFSNAFIQQMTMILKRANPNIDPKAIVILEEEITAIIHEEIVASNALSKMAYPIYDKHFSSDELRQMIELNNTALGKKMIQVMPIITQEGMQAGQILGQSLGPKIQQRVADRLEKEGIR